MDNLLVLEIEHKDDIINSQMVVIENLLKQIRNRNDAIEYSFQRIKQLTKYKRAYYRSVDQLKKCLKILKKEN